VVDAALGRARLVSQGLVIGRWERPVDAAAAFGAQQGQDLPGVLASIALRSDGGIAAVLEACGRGEIVRGYPMRGTVFLTAAADLRWITELCAEKSLRESSRIIKSRGIGTGHVERSAAIAAEELAAGPRSRAHLHACWKQAGLLEANGANYHLTFQHIASGTLCYGPVVDGDQHVVLAEHWLPQDSGLEGRFNGDRDAACAELLRRYLDTHGPATLRDFSWWSKLPLGQIRRAFPLVRDQFEELPGDEPRYQRNGLADEMATMGRRASRPILLPDFDEFILGYQDRLFALTEADHRKLVPGNNGFFRRSAVAGGRVVGSWQRKGAPGRRNLELTPFIRLSNRAITGFEKAFRSWPFLTE
jgi:hypothetical protein